MYNYFKIDESSLKEKIIFELKSLYGRYLKNLWLNYSYRKWKDPILIDFGCGGNIKKQWINADFFSVPKVKFWKKRMKKLKPNFELDLRYPIKLPNNFADGVYSGHTLEHLYPKQAVSFLREIYRILKPGAWLRINVPDLERFISFYEGRLTSIEFKDYSTGCEAIGALTQDSGHHSVWDKKLLISILEQLNFINVKEVEFAIEGVDKRLIKEEAPRKWSTLVIEAQKSL